jgi:Nif-specific regulatory protein
MPKLVIKEGPGKGDAFKLSEEQVSIGRDAGNTIRLADRTVSRCHARILYSDGGCYVSDLDSHNGTIVNGERVSRCQLKHTDEIRLGNVTLLFLEDEVTNMDVLLEGYEREPEITQAIDFEEGQPLEGAVEGSRSELITSNKRLLALTELAQQAATIRSLPTLFDVVIDSMNQTLDPDRVVPIVRQEDGSLLPYVRAESGFGKGLESAGISKRLVEQSIEKGVAALSQKPALKEVSGGTVPDPERITSTMCAPLGGRKPLGVLYCDRIERREKYVRSDLQYLCSVAAQVGVAMENIRAYEEVAARARTLEREVEGQYNLVGQSSQMEEVYEFIRKAAPTDASVLICGESGTGKELVARAIRYNSNRSDGPFETLNCAAMSQTLIESELFGHVKGAFTGAINDRPGRFELAHKGTIFLDEIGALPLDCQTKLLRVLETGTVRRVGDVKDRQVDARVIAATNEDLEEAREQGRFREDLFYRLDVLRKDLPPLRERGNDIKLLARHFLSLFQEKTGKPIEGFAAEVLQIFHAYQWPGNVRELKNIVERMVIMCENAVLSPELLPPEIRREQGEVPAAAPAAREPEQLRSLDELEKQHIYRVLRSTEGNKKRAAEILGVDRSTLYARLKRYEEQDE